MNRQNFASIPQGSILGINYSGMHDSAIAIVAPTGKTLFAVSLERLSREKQDGRPPYALLENMPWDKIDSIAVSTEQAMPIGPAPASKIHPICFSQLRSDGEPHERPFFDFLETLAKPKHYICHQLSHASAAFWPSGFKSSLCLTYDGGMSNCLWFGGLYMADVENGIQAVDNFALSRHPRITSLYTGVTALLGFTPNKHEGKITGLAAYGKATRKCRDILESFLSDEITAFEHLTDWFFRYDTLRPPMLVVNETRRKALLPRFEGISREDLAATVQALTEEHILEIIRNARLQGWNNVNMCLSGGLFSNVKVNQRVKEAGFECVFVSPPMTDDGTAMGAALQLLASRRQLKPSKIHSMALGPFYQASEIEQTLNLRAVCWTKIEDPAEVLGNLLAEGKTIAMFEGAMEFGPRALGNRSILASASDADINRRINLQLNRTEFMPFAPMSLMEDTETCYLDSQGIQHAAEFMTITSNCTPLMRAQCPAVVHTDGTARPQLVDGKQQPFLHNVIDRYKKLTGHPAIVNTSFNIHEEPIVCSPDDAIDGFLEAGLDYLYLHPGYLLSFEQNQHIALKHFQTKRTVTSRKTVALSDLKNELFDRLETVSVDLENKNRALSDCLQKSKNVNHGQKDATKSPLLQFFKKILR